MFTYLPGSPNGEAETADVCDTEETGKGKQTFHTVAPARSDLTGLTVKESLHRDPTRPAGCFASLSSSFSPGPGWPRLQW